MLRLSEAAAVVATVGVGVYRHPRLQLKAVSVAGNGREAKVPLPPSASLGRRAVLPLRAQVLRRA